MLPKKERISKVLFGEYLKKTKTFSSNLLSVRVHFLKNGEKSRFSVITPKSVSKKAVDRNLVRRQIYSILKENKPKIPIICFVFIKKQASFSEYRESLKEVFTQIYK